MASKHVIVQGQVQGVFYRQGAQDTARELGVAGWVRNRDDGSVEMVVEGDDEAVERMVSWAREGTSQSQVTSVDVADTEPQGLSGFEQV